MGRVIRWFRNILGLKKKDKGERRNSSFGKPKEQSKHTAANAAVTATEAAVSVVRLTSHGRKTMLGGGRETWGALKIQSSFLGHLARKALRALKGLVKFQTLIRGYLVRKKATATLHSLQTLIRAQQTVRVQKTSGRNATDIRPPHRKSVVRMRKSIPLKCYCTQDHQMLSSTLPCQCQVPAHPEFGCGFNGDKCRSPRFMNEPNGPVVPAKRPNYMSTTQSFRAKMRPQQWRKKSLSEVPMQWSSCSQVQQVIFKNAVMRGLDR
ncbi:hypothetical protein Sjap_021128 [Stephania japonica]|uniref:DUF4005 domain-containing protein n=1 Tax=Stephania japonica TaxID=461633 RepID=A0AAP0I182_9MAGN